LIKHGKAPYLECSSKGDKRFSAFYARVEYNGLTLSIEEHYQRAKVFEGGVTGLDWRRAKGRTPINGEFCRKLYSQLWRDYIRLNPHLLEILKEATGLSDVFGQEGHCCQATELWKIRNENKTGQEAPSDVSN
jgi:hypothetical protein